MLQVQRLVLHDTSHVQSFERPTGGLVRREEALNAQLAKRTFVGCLKISDGHEQQASIVSKYISSS
jgi:hypothetical protein